MKHPRLMWKAIYHRGDLDDRLVDEVLRSLEVAFSQLNDDTNWALAFYLIYAPTDRNYFNTWSTRHELKKAVATLFWKEAAKVIHGTPDPEESLLREYGFSLRLYDPESPFRCRIEKSRADLSGQDWFSVEADLFLCEDAYDLTARGRFAALARALPIIQDEEPVSGKLICDGNIEVSPHLDSSQRGARGRRKQIYVTKRSVPLLVGPHPGCDLLASSMKSSYWMNLVEIRKARTLDTRPESEGRIVAAGDDFNIRYLDAERNKEGVTQKFVTVLREVLERRDLSLEVIGRVLPRGSGDRLSGYGTDWCHLSSAERPLKVSLRLSHNAILAADSKDVVFVRDEVKRVDRDLQDSDSVVVEDVRYTWQRDSTGFFYGSLFFEKVGEAADPKRRTCIPIDEPVSGVIARSAVVPHKTSLLAEYHDDEFISQRGSINIESDGEHSVAIGPTLTSNLGIYVLEKSKWRCFDRTADRQLIQLRVPCEFAFGSSRFALTYDRNAYSLEPHWSNFYTTINWRGVTPSNQ